MPAIVTIIGNVGKDPEMRYTPNGRPVTTFSVAVNNGRKNPDTGEWTDATDWYRCSVWGDGAERAAEGLRKGHKVTVWGRLKTREWQANDGQTRTALEVDAYGFQNQAPRDAPAASQGNASGFDDLPF